MACAKTEAAKVLVVSLYLSLCRTLDALDSISLPVCLPELVCDKADAASSFWIEEEDELLKVCDAREPTAFDVCLELFDMINYPFYKIY